MPVALVPCSFCSSLMNKYFILLQIVSDVFREWPAGIMEKQNTELHFFVICIRTLLRN
jgi:hypothetical protein